MRSLRFAALLVVLLLSAACSSDETDKASNAALEASGIETTGGFTEPTMSSGTTESMTPPEGTINPSNGEPDAVLRLEGASGTRFSGVCKVGAEASLIEGRVPKRFGYDLDGERLTCRIQKRDSGAGALKVILTAGGDTRSVQQTNSRGGEISISYRSSR